jgi:multidrug resistance efflux pump
LEHNKEILLNGNGVSKENGSVIKNSFSGPGNEMQDILSNKPPFIVRWGIGYFFLLLLMMGAISWFIKYPDIVIAHAKLSAVNAAKQVNTRTDGKLTRIAVKEDQRVEAGQVLGWMESTADPGSEYPLKAPVAGVVSFAGFFQENQEMKTGQTLFYVQPDNTSYFAEMLVAQNNFGKVRQGQRVLLKFQAYPFEQYGSVMGIIDYINGTPSDSGYLVKVIFPHALVTNFKKKLPYRDGLTAQADIITEDLRLSQRFFHTMSRQFTR